MFNTSYSTLELVVYCIWFGIVIGSIMMYYEKRVMGGFIRALIRSGADSPENAKHVGELKLRMNFLIANALKSPGSSLRHTVVCVGEEPVDGKYPDKKRIKDINRERYYIPKDKTFSAEDRYNKKNTTIVLVIITVVATFILARLIVRYTPELLGAFRERWNA